jgi:hypothetical protein
MFRAALDQRRGTSLALVPRRIRGKIHALTIER